MCKILTSAECSRILITRMQRGGLSVPLVALDANGGCVTLGRVCRRISIKGLVLVKKKNSSEELNGGFVGFRCGRVSTTVSEYLLCMHSEIDFAKHPLA